jgi:hypothetical protein
MTTIKTTETRNRSHAKRRSSKPARPLSDYPELMPVTEAATYLRIATSTAYVLANLHLDGTSQDCMPAVRVGGCIRVVSARLSAVFGSGEQDAGSSRESGR